MTWWAALASAGIGALSARRAGNKASEAQEDANQMNLDEAARNRGFQEEMSNTSYQRSIEDMKAAGINPMLSSKVGGASTPTGSVAAPAQNTATPGINSALAVANAALDTYTRKVQAENVEAQTGKTVAETEKVRRETPGEGAYQAEQAGRIELNKSQQAQVNENVEQLKRQNKIGADFDWNNAYWNSVKTAESVEVQRSMLAETIARTENIKEDAALKKANRILAEYAQPQAKRGAEHAAGPMGAARPWLRDLGEILNSAKRGADLFR
ncbi:VP2 [Gokushovirus WZ-2015a]|nr:VP2 [Gokushovirus WZ-2015a]